MTGGEIAASSRSIGTPRNDNHQQMLDAGYLILVKKENRASRINSLILLLSNSLSAFFSATSAFSAVKLKIVFLYFSVEGSFADAEDFRAK